MYRISAPWLIFSVSLNFQSRMVFKVVSTETTKIGIKPAIQEWLDANQSEICVEIEQCCHACLWGNHVQFFTS